MKETLKKLFDITFWKFILVGVANTLFGSAVMFLFYNVLLKGLIPDHVNYWISSACNYVFGSILSYFLNRYFTFKSQENAKSTLPRFVIGISLCYLLAYGLAKPGVAWLLSSFSTTVKDNAAMLAGMCLFVGFNYISQRFFVFREKGKN